MFAVRSQLQAATKWEVLSHLATADHVRDNKARVERPAQIVPDNHAIVRFSTAIQPGEMQTISVPEPYGSPSHEMHIHRRGDQIEVLAAGVGSPDH